MPRPLHRGSEDARNELPLLLQAAERGRSTIISRRGKPVAALVPVELLQEALPRQQSLLEAIGSGKGLWGRDSMATLRRLRNEWSR